jgi:SAM-dependent methyltransferase
VNSRQPPARSFRHEVKFAVPWWAVAIHPSYMIRRAIYHWVKSALTAETGTCLDFGCGAAPYRQEFRGERYVGIDVPVSGHNHQDSHVDVFFDGFRLPFADGAFDVVLASEVLEHVENRAGALAEVRRVLIAGGRLIVTTPFLFPEHEVPQDFARFTERGLQSELLEAGFATERAGRFGTPIEVLGQLCLGYFRDVARRCYCGKLATPVLCAIINIPSIVLGLILPKNNAYYLGIGLVCRKTP